MKEISQEFIDKGEEGVRFVEQICLKKNISFVKGTREEDLKYGIDCYIDNQPTDVKNTEDLYICQIFINNGIINTRHPFKTSSRATHYYIVNTKKNKAIEFVEIEKKLLRDYIKDEKALKQFLSILKEIDGKSFKNYGLHLAHACIQIKEKLTTCLKPPVKISYPDPETSTEIYFKLSKRKASTINYNQTAITSVLYKLKNGFGNEPEEIINVDI
jgi:hypothetical protein